MEQGRDAWRIPSFTLLFIASALLFLALGSSLCGV